LNLNHFYILIAFFIKILNKNKFLNLPFGWRFFDGLKIFLFIRIRRNNPEPIILLK